MKTNQLFLWFKAFVTSQNRLRLIFCVIIMLILTSTTFSAYFMQRLGDALEVTISENIPALTSALYLSEQGTVLSATAPVLAVSQNRKQLDETYHKLVEILDTIKEKLEIFSYNNNIQHTTRLGQDSRKMAEVLSRLKRSTGKRLSFSETQANVLADIQSVQQDLVEILDPVEYGVTSLTNLFSRRIARRIDNYLKKIGSDNGAIGGQSRLSKASAYIDDEVSQFTGIAIKDMGYALALKASGNNLINLLFILSNAEDITKIALLHNLYSKELSKFSLATEIFTNSALAIRNPILSNNVHLISDKFQTLRTQENNLFTLRTKQLEINDSSLKLLDETRSIANLMSEHSKKLAGHVDQQMQKLEREMKVKRKTGILIVSLVSGGCFLLVCFIAFGTIIAFKQQEEELQYSHNQLEYRVQQRTQELHKSCQQLAHADRLTSLGEMATGVAHEINQPLHIIALSLEALRMYFSRHDCDAFTGESVDTIQAQVDRAATILKNMRTFARHDSGSNSPVNLVEHTQVAISFFKEQFRLHQIQLTVSLADNHPLVETDIQKFEQVVVNLLSNARYAVEKKAETSPDEYIKKIKIRLFHDSIRKMVVFEIADNGMGMSAEVQEHCMEPFYTTKEPGEGTGLGMSISHNIITSFGGSLELKSQEGSGTTFSVFLPEAKG